MILKFLEFRPIEMAQTLFLHRTRPDPSRNTIKSLELLRKYLKTISDFFEIFAHYPARLPREKALFAEKKFQLERFFLSG